MKQMKLIETEDLEQLVQGFACNVDHKPCMYEECTECKDAQLTVSYTGDLTAATEIWWWEWRSKTEEREKKSTGK